MTLELAIKTAAWQEASDQEPNAYAIFERVKPDYKILRTDKKKPLVFDGWIMHNPRQGAYRTLPPPDPRLDHQATSNHAHAKYDMGTRAAADDAPRQGKFCRPVSPTTQVSA